jgi:uncharacterized membrane protein
MAQMRRVETATEEGYARSAARKRFNFLSRSSFGWLVHGIIVTRRARRATRTRRTSAATSRALSPSVRIVSKLEPPFDPIAMRYLLATLSLAGVLVSSLALQVHYSTATEPCSINEHWDCGIVNHSSYAVVFGIPVAAVGIAGYLLLGILALARRRFLLLFAALIGLGFALHLSGIERNILSVWCLYCVISQAIIALITLLTVAWIVGRAMTKRRATQEA